MRRKFTKYSGLWTRRKPSFAWEEKKRASKALWKMEFNSSMPQSLRSQPLSDQSSSAGSGGSEEHRAVISYWNGKCRAVKTWFTASHMLGVDSWSLLADKSIPPPMKFSFWQTSTTAREHLGTLGKVLSFVMSRFPLKHILALQEAHAETAFPELCLTTSIRAHWSKDPRG